MSNGVRRRAGGTSVGVKMAWGLGALVAMMLWSAAPATAQDESSIRSGMNIWRSKANCQICHGWSGNGEKMDNQMPDGANLRETPLDREGIAEVIRCGRPGTGMPAFERNPYSDGRCYGMKQADLRAAGLTLTDPGNTLVAREIDDVLNFLFAKVVGKGPMNKEKCIEFWGQAVAVCNDVPAN